MNAMAIAQSVGALILCGFALYVIAAIPMDAAIARLIRAVVILGAVLYVLRALGLWHWVGL